MSVSKKTLVRTSLALNSQSHSEFFSNTIISLVCFCSLSFFTNLCVLGMVHVMWDAKTTTKQCTLTLLKECKVWG